MLPNCPKMRCFWLTNAVSDVQAMAYALNGIDYMGFQFHPEVPLEVFQSGHARNAKLPGTICELVDFPGSATQGSD